MADAPITRTPAEEARAEVEAWLATLRDDAGRQKYVPDSHYEDIDRDDFDALVARLTPVFERAQEGMPRFAKAQIDALRDRAERAEAALVLACAARDANEADVKKADAECLKLEEALQAAESTITDIRECNRTLTLAVAEARRALESTARWTFKDGTPCWCIRGPVDSEEQCATKRRAMGITTEPPQ